MNIKDLELILITYGIPYEKWDTGRAKSLQDLLKEIEKDDCILGAFDGILTRKILGVQINVHAHVVTKWNGPKEHYILKEVKQILRNGRVRDRSQMRASVTEKRRPWETSMQTAIRGLEEELKFHNHDGGWYKLTFSGRELDIDGDHSMSYPGLPTIIRELTTFTCVINPALFEKDGYIVPEDDKTNFFVWEKVKKGQ